MGEFRIGRKFASHSYPDPPRTAAAAQFARNSALVNSLIAQPLPAAGAKIKWDSIEVGTAGSTVVPITPITTGIVRVIVTVVVKNTAATPNVMGVTLIVDGIPISIGSLDAVDADLFTTIPFLADLPLTVGPTHQIEVEVKPELGGTSTSIEPLSFIDVQELPPATG